MFFFGKDDVFFGVDVGEDIDGLLCCDDVVDECGVFVYG